MAFPTPERRESAAAGCKMAFPTPERRKSSAAGCKIAFPTPERRRSPRSRPSLDTETSRKPPNPAVSSLLRHRDLSKSAETRSLVPPPTPRPLKIRRNLQSRPSPDTETSHNPPNPAVSSLLRHRDLSAGDFSPHGEAGNRRAVCKRGRFTHGRRSIPPASGTPTQCAASKRAWIMTR